MPIPVIAIVVISSLLVVAPSGPLPQSINRDRARLPYEQGLTEMRAEAFEAALKSFQSAVAIDSEYEMAYYMLGRVHLMMRNYSAAVTALSRSSDLFRAQGAEVFTDQQESQQRRRQQIADLSEAITQLQTQKPTPQVLEQIRQYTERRRQLQDMDRHQRVNPEHAVPGFVSLSLGAALYRAGRSPEAERAYLATLAADPKIGEAHNNLAVIYMESGRLDAAEKAVKAAEKAGMRVNSELKEEIRRRKQGG